jgi:hypothetical protein
LASAQPIGLGLKIGGTLSDAVSAIGHGDIPASHAFVIGPSLELRLPFGFGVELDALYEHSLYNSVLNGGNTWQFPLLAKYKLLKGPVRPFIDGGVSFSHITDLQEIPDLNHRNNFGIVLGAGLDLKLLVVHITPEIRYNGWTLKNIQSVPGFFESNQNQATLLVGFGF